MSTRGVIARFTQDKEGNESWEGRYHHFDSYPSGLGCTLYEVYTGHFKRDLEAMLSVLIDQHPAGWSTINDADFNLEPGFTGFDSSKDSRPRCYCHGDMGAEEDLFTPERETYPFIEFFYVFDVAKREMHVFDIRRNLLGVVDLENPEPHWWHKMEWWKRED